MSNKNALTLYTFSRLFSHITTHKAVNIIIVKRSVTTETRYDIVHVFYPNAQ